MCLRRFAWPWWTLLLAAGPACSEPPQPPQRPPPNCDRPLGRIDCDQLPIAGPLPADLAADDRDRPYHLLVRTWSFPRIAPLDVEVESVRVLGAASGRRIAPGEYLFERLGSAQVNCGYYRQREPAAPVPGVPAPTGPARDRMEPIATRVALPLARHATTVCDLYVPTDVEAAAPIEFRGIVLDRETGGPIAGATVKLRASGAEVSTGSDGTFRFDEPLAWSTLLQGTTVEKPGWFGAGINQRSLLSLWIERLQLDGVAAFALSPDRRAEPPRKTIPPLRN